MTWYHCSTTLSENVHTYLFNMNRINFGRRNSDEHSYGWSRLRIYVEVNDYYYCIPWNCVYKLGNNLLGLCDALLRILWFNLRSVTYTRHRDVYDLVGYTVQSLSLITLHCYYVNWWSIPVYAFPIRIYCAVRIGTYIPWKTITSYAYLIPHSLFDAFFYIEFNE